MSTFFIARLQYCFLFPQILQDFAFQRGQTADDDSNVDFETMR